MRLKVAQLLSIKYVLPFDMHLSHIPVLTICVNKIYVPNIRNWSQCWRKDIILSPGL